MQPACVVKNGIRTDDFAHNFKFISNRANTTTFSVHMYDICFQFAFLRFQRVNRTVQQTHCLIVTNDFLFHGFVVVFFSSLVWLCFLNFMAHLHGVCLLSFALAITFFVITISFIYTTYACFQLFYIDSII